MEGDLELLPRLQLQAGILPDLVCLHIEERGIRRQQQLGWNRRRIGNLQSSLIE